MVETVAGKHVHHRVFALAGRLHVIGGERRVRRAVHQEQHGARRFARSRLADALAIHGEHDIALLRPVVVRDDRVLGAVRLRLRARGKARQHSGAEADPGRLEYGAAREGLFLVR
jgi:hypothetical protein